LKRLLDLLIAFKEYVALTLFVSASLTLIAVSRTTDVMPLRAFATVLVGTVQSSYAWIPNPFALRRENEELHAKSIELSSEVGRLRRAEAENKELRRMLGIAPRPGWKLIPAEVIGKTTTFQRNMLTINLGSSDGIEPGMAAVTDAGIAGRIYSTSSNFSLVQMLFNTDLRVAAKIARTRVEGIISWEGAGALSLTMHNIPKAFDVQLGDLVVSSEYSQFFPADVAIGTVDSLAPETNSLFRRVLVKPSVDFFRVEHVFVILKDSERERERISLENKAKDNVVSASPVTKSPAEKAPFTKVPRK
jgi:rod shape-determining protein MreC